MNLVYVSKNSWWDGRKARKVLLPLAFANLENSKVLLVNTPSVAWKLRRNPNVWDHPSLSFSVLTPLRLLPFQRLRWVRKINQWFRWRSIKHQIKTKFKGDSGLASFILSDPEDLYLANYIKKSGYSCYFDWTEKWDLYAAASGLASESKIDNQCGILSFVDGVIIVSRELEQESKKLGLKCLHLQNAVSENFISSLNNITILPDELKDIPEPRVFHVGSYDPSWINWEWLVLSAKDNLGVSFCMLGGGGEQGVPKNIPANIFLLGRVEYERIPSFLAHAQACMLLYKPEQTSAGDPTKLYEYLATGLPIVSSPHPRCIEFKDYIYLANDAEEFSRMLAQSLNEDGALKVSRKEIAMQHTWMIRAKELRSWLKDG